MSKWLSLPDITLTNGSKVVAVNDGTSLIDVEEGDALVYAGLFYEIESKTQTTITLVDNWAGATANNVAGKVMFTIASIAALYKQAVTRLNATADVYDSLEVQDSPTDTTPGRLATTEGLQYVDPRQFGLGSDTAPEITSHEQLDSTIIGGVYSVGSIFDGTLTVKARSSNRTSQYREVWGGGSTDPIIEWRISDDSGATWSPWKNFWTESNYQPETSGTGMGVVRLLKNNTGSSADGSTTSGSNLELTYAGATGSLVGAGISPTGTWKQVAGFALSAGNFSWYVRIS